MVYHVSAWGVRKGLSLDRGVPFRVKSNAFGSRRLGFELQLVRMTPPQPKQCCQRTLVSIPGEDDILAGVFEAAASTMG